MLLNKEPVINWKLLAVPVIILQLIGLTEIKSLSTEFLSYILILIVSYFVFYFISKVDFEIFSAFSPYFYLISVFILFVNLIIGNTTRGVVRWVEIGNYSIQPSEVVRPFLFLFMSLLAYRYATKDGSLLKLLVVGVLPVALIALQPSFGVAMLTFAGLIGVLIASGVNKGVLARFTMFLLLIGPLVLVLLKPYQKERLFSFTNPWKSATGAGYNSIQSMISVGSGLLFGRGLGEGVGTKLRFLPEKNTDFIFAAISEELGFVVSIVILGSFFVFFWLLIKIYQGLPYSVAKIYASAFFVSIFFQTVINIGMNLGMVPITGVPLPFVSEGGSSLLSTLVSTALLISAVKNVS